MIWRSELGQELKVLEAMTPVELASNHKSVPWRRFFLGKMRTMKSWMERCKNGTYWIFDKIGMTFPMNPKRYKNLGGSPWTSNFGMLWLTVGLPVELTLRFLTSSPLIWLRRSPIRAFDSWSRPMACHFGCVWRWMNMGPFLMRANRGFLKWGGTP